MARYYQKPRDPRYYNFGGMPTRHAYSWRGRANSAQRPGARLDLGHDGLGEANFNESFYKGTYDENLQKSYYNLPGDIPDVPKQVIDYLGRPGRGRPEPLSPQRYPKWQLESMARRSGLGLFETLSDMQKSIGLLAVGSVAAFLLLRKGKKR